jgi:hypothetical protein
MQLVETGNGVVLLQLQFCLSSTFARRLQPSTNPSTQIFLYIDLRGRSLRLNGGVGSHGTAKRIGIFAVRALRVKSGPQQNTGRSRDEQQKSCSPSSATKSTDNFH